MEQLLRGAEQPVSAVMTPEEDISAEEMAAYIDDRLSSEERASVEARLAQNPDLRAELVAATRIVSAPDSAKSRRAFPWKAAGVLAAAAAAVVLVVVVPSRNRDFRPSPAPAERRAEAEDGGRVNLLGPGDAAIVPVASANFAWHSEGDASYRITIADATGATVWTALTSDTTATLPATIVLRPGNHYYWYVDALRIDGSSIASGPRSFTTNTQ
jgi:anti-sigma factor RsiW